MNWIKLVLFMMQHILMVYKFFDSKVSGSGAKRIPQNEQLANELHEPIIRKFEKRRVYSTFKDNI